MTKYFSHLAMLCILLAALVVICSCATPATTPSPTVPAPPSVSPPPPTQKPPPVPKEVELKYDNNKSRDALSYTGGHIVDFSPPTTPFIVKTIRVAGFLSPKADKGVENKTFDLEILDKDLKVIYTVAYPYSRFSSTATSWVNFEVPDVNVNDKFYIHVYTQSPRYGLHIGADDSVVNEHSDVTSKDAAGNVLILAFWPYGPSSEYWFGDKSKVNWMIRVVGTTMVPQE